MLPLEPHWWWIMGSSWAGVYFSLKREMNNNMLCCPAECFTCLWKKNMLAKWGRAAKGVKIILQVTSILLHLWSHQSKGEFRLVKLNLFSEVVEMPPTHQYREDAAGEHSTQMQQVTALSTGPAQERLRLRGFLYPHVPHFCHRKDGQTRINSCLHQNPLVGCLLNCPYGLDIEGICTRWSQGHGHGQASLWCPDHITLPSSPQLPVDLWPTGTCTTVNSTIKSTCSYSAGLAFTTDCCPRKPAQNITYLLYVKT